MKISHKISLSFFIVGLILTVSAESILYWIAKDDLQKSIYNNLSAIVASRANHIETYLQTLEASVGQLSKSVVLENLLKATGKEDRVWSDAFKTAMKRLKRTKDVNPGIAEFLLLDVRGKVVASSNENSVGSDKSKDTIFLNGRKEADISDVYYSKADKEPLMAASAPFLDSQTDELIGVIVARVRLSELNGIASERAGMGDTGEIYIVNRDGYIITPCRFKKDAVLKEKVETKNVRLAWLHTGKEHPLSQEKSINVYNSCEGVPVLGTHAYIRQMQWAVLAEIEAKEAFRPLVKLRLVFLAIIFMVSIAVWLFGIFLGRVIAGPIHRLHEGTEIIGSGNLDHKVGTDATDEVGQLSRAFDEMTENLKKTTTSIAVLDNEIFEREKVEQAQKRLVAIIEATSDFVGFADAKNKHIIYINKAGRKMVGIDEDEDVTKLKIFDIHPEWTNKMFAEEILPAAVRDGTWTGECAFLNIKDKHEIPVLMVLNSHKASNGEVEVFSTISRNITERKKAEEELSDSHKRLTNVLDSIDSLVYVADLNSYELLFINKYGRDIWGDMQGRKCWQVIQEGQKGPCSFCTNDRLVSDTGIPNKVYQWEFQNTVNNRWYECRDQAIPWIGKALVRMEIATDITERKKAENEIKKQNEFVGTIINSLQYPFYVIGTDYTILLSNKAAKERDLVEGGHCYQITHHFQEPCSGEHMCPLKEVIRTGKPAVTEHTHFDDYGNSRIFEVHGDPILDKNGQVIQMIEYSIDITERKKAEKAIKEEKEKSESYLNTAEIMILALDTDARITLINRKGCQLLGYTKDELVGKNWFETCVPSRDSEQVREVHKKIISGESQAVEYYENSVRTKNGQERFIAWHNTMIRNAESQITGTLSSGEDITDRKELEKSQRLAQLGMLVANIAHEVNNPLMVISGRVQLSMMENEQNEEIKNNFQIIFHECQRAKDIIQRLRQFAQPSKGEPRMIDINAGIENIVSILEKQYSLENIMIKRNYGQGLPSVFVDEKLMQEVFMNLLTNAHDAIGRDGHIQIITTRQDSRVRIDIQDTGCGMSAEIMGKIFEPFFTTKEKGTGLGLSVSNSIVKTHNGQLTVDSAPGKGTTISIILPIDYTSL